MELQNYLAFLLASSLILVVPGPTILLVISQASTHGRKSVFPLASGVVLGDACAMSCSLIGLGMILATSASLFTLFKYLGAGYLVYLGIRLWRKETGPKPALAVRQGSLLRSAFIVTALNPKSIAFFVAFLPQFILPEMASAPQLLLLGVSFLILAWCNAMLYGMLADRFIGRLVKGAGRKFVRRCGGTALVGAGLFTATVRQTAE
jgi:threonine/homoserine/homoserine lactone efflux protein